MKPFTVFLVRHGEAETQWGNDDDPGLSQNGIDQAQNLITVSYTHLRAHETN